MAVEASRRQGDADYRNWVRHLPRVLRNLNRKFVGRTRFRRNVVDDSNFDALLEALYGAGASTLRNTSALSAASISSRAWRERIFRFAPGQRVRVNKAALGTRGRFEKTSQTGGYDPRVFAVRSRSLRSAGPQHLVPGKS